MARDVWPVHVGHGHVSSIVWKSFACLLSSKIRPSYDVIQALRKAKAHTQIEGSVMSESNSKASRSGWKHAIGLNIFRIGQATKKRSQTISTPRATHTSKSSANPIPIEYLGPKEILVRYDILNVQRHERSSGSFSAHCFIL